MIALQDPSLVERITLELVTAENVLLDGLRREPQFLIALARAYADAAGIILATAVSEGQVLEAEVDEEVDELNEIIFTASRHRLYGKRVMFNFRAWLGCAPEKKKGWFR